ncbi:hypothetical protein SAMN05661044_03445 [Olivibacter domesticus]|uniref:Uncharacterized protein n=1 Tax=Olivibacter domesticus TaxID=407022 RepID=A0A1H7TCD3_OLID1|nr:hypothetical protein SAMN05661044_03445 [Olivibacter domesticus]
MNSLLHQVYNSYGFSNNELGTINCNLDSAEIRPLYWHQLLPAVPATAHDSLV